MGERRLTVGGAERKVLLEAEAKALLSQRGVPTTACHQATSADEAVRWAERVGYPVALKVSSPKIVHKSDVGGVALGLADAKGVRHAYREVMAKARPIDPGAGVVVQEMVDPGFEAIVGVTSDPHFGRVLLVGTGGVFTELLEDVTFGLVPVGLEHAWRMVRSLRGYPLLAGYRGQGGKDVGALVEVLLAVSHLVQGTPQIVELDLNPVVVQERGAVVVDARIVLRGDLGPA